MRVIITLIITLFVSISAMADISVVKGKIVDSKTGKGVAGVSIKLSTGASATSNSEGVFELSNVLPGKGVLIITAPQMLNRTLDVVVNQDQQLDLGDIAVEKASTQDQATILLDESAIANDEDKSQNVSSLLASSDDVFFSSAGFLFGTMRFNLRGYDQDNFTTYINGINFNSTERGNFQYSSIGGLNDAVRNRDAGNGLEMTAYSFGNIGGTSNIDLRPSRQSVGTKASLAFSNRSYTTRAMATYSTGILKNGWAFTVSGSQRWAEEGNIKGTYYNSWAYLVSAEKIFNNKHSLSISTFGAPTERGTSSGTTQEMYDLVGDNQYNPNWGYQQGKKRNARIVNSFEPSLIVSYEWKIDPKTTFNAGIAGRISKYSKTGLNWYNAPDPRPDYYRYLPSYLINGSDEPMPYLVQFRTNLIKNDVSRQQINWDEIYMANYNRVIKGQDTATYIQERAHDDYKELTFNATINKAFNNGLNFIGGLEARTYVGSHYKTLEDLLGGKYWMDIDQFAERDFGTASQKQQNDLNNPNRKVYVDDKFGYDYEIHAKTANAWTSITLNQPKYTVSVGAKYSFNSYYRYGNMRNGRAADNSYGKGSVNNFGDIATKANLLYKLSGKHMIAANASFETRSPLAYNAYLSPRIKNTQIPDMSNGKIYSGDLGYIFNTSAVRGRITGYYTKFENQIEIDNFYNDVLKTFVNHVMTNVNKENVGVEMGVTAKVTSQVSLTFIGNYGKYRYTNRPNGTTSTENGSQQDTQQPIYLKNFYLGGMPQLATSLGFDYFHPKMWFFNTNINYYDKNYVSIMPTRRTAAALNFATAGMTQEEVNAKAKAIVDQEKFAASFVWDASVGKLIYFKNKTSLSINLTVQNILNKKDIRTGGFEQGRFDTESFNVGKFPSKYFYMQGINYFLNIGYRF